MSVEIALLLVGFVVVLIFKGIKSVPQGHNWTVERFGKFTRLLSPGLHDHSLCG